MILQSRNMNTTVTAGAHIPAGYGPIPYSQTGLAHFVTRYAEFVWDGKLLPLADAEELIRERYRGIRPAAGYPSCPDHTEKRALFDLLGAEQSAGITLTESFAMLPAASVSGLYFAHPEARYFTVDLITRDPKRCRPTDHPAPPENGRCRDQTD